MMVLKVYPLEVYLGVAAVSTIVSRWASKDKCTVMNQLQVGFLIYPGVITGFAVW